VVSAHPDGVDFGASGTVASWTAAGTGASCCVCTSGEASTEPAAAAGSHTRPGLDLEPLPVPELWPGAALCAHKSQTGRPGGLEERMPEHPGRQRTVTALRPDGWRRRSKW
jgi:LmbE family N-acetylglucosaminyl deacetylase